MKVKRLKTPSKPSYTLEDYPHAIAQAQTAIANLDIAMAEAQTELKLIEQVVDQQVAFDKELKNDGQRKARRRELLSQDDGYDLLKGKRETDQRTRERLNIRLSLLLNQFSVAKIQARQLTAQLRMAS